MALTEDQANSALFDKSFAEQFDKLVGSKPVWCAKKNADVALGAERIPDTVVIDVNASQSLQLSVFELTIFKVDSP